MDNFFKKKFLMPKVMTNMTPTTFKVASRVLSNSMTGIMAMKKVAGVLSGRSNVSEYTTVVYQSYVMASYIIEAESHGRMMHSKRKPVAPSPKVKVQSYAAKRPGFPRVRVKTVDSMTGIMAMKKVAGVLLRRSNASEYTTAVDQSYVMASYIIEAESHGRMMHSKRRPVAPSPEVKVPRCAAKRPGFPGVRVKTAVSNPVAKVVVAEYDWEASHGVAKAVSTEKAEPVQVVKEMPAATPAPEPVAAEAVDKAEAPRQKLTIEKRLTLENIIEYCLNHTYKYNEVKPIYDMLFNMLCGTDDPRWLEALDQIRQRMQQLESRTIIIQSGSHVVVDQHVGSYIANVSQGAIGVKVEKD